MTCNSGRQYCCFRLVDASVLLAQSLTNLQEHQRWQQQSMCILPASCLIFLCCHVCATSEQP